VRANRVEGRRQKQLREHKISGIEASRKQEEDYLALGGLRSQHEDSAGPEQDASGFERILQRRVGRCGAADGELHQGERDAGQEAGNGGADGGSLEGVQGGFVFLGLSKSSICSAAGCGKHGLAACGVSAIDSWATFWTGRQNRPSRG
jgi:hypothetical protein